MVLRRWLPWIALAGAALLWPSSRVAARPGAAPPAQPTSFPTPTPGPDGRILYTVQPGDSLWRIAAIAGRSVEELAALNGMLVDDFLSPGMVLVLGLGGPVAPTAAPITPAATQVAPTATPLFGTGEVCVLLFVDANGNARLDEGELPLPDGRVTIVDIGGFVAGEHTTDETPEGHCFAGLENTDYNVSAAVPPGYNPTTAMSLPLRLQPGEVKSVEFAAQPGGALQGDIPPEERARSTALGILGVVLVAGAGALAYYASRLGRRTPMSLR
jgi:hypothetical protein